MNFKPTLIKCICTIIVFLTLMTIDVATSCLGGQLSCEPPQYYCECLKQLNQDYNSSELTDDIIQQNCARNLQNQATLPTITDCQNIKCKQVPCGGIGGLSVIILGTLLFYVIYSLIQRNKDK